MYSLMEVLEQLRQGFAGGRITQEEYADAVKEWDRMLADGSVELTDYTRAMDALDIALNGTTEAQQAELAAMLGGQEAMSGLLAIVNASESDFGKLEVILPPAKPWRSCSRTSIREYICPSSSVLGIGGCGSHELYGDGRVED